MYFITQQKNGVAALELKRHLGVSYPTAWSLKHKLMQVMKETDDRRPLSGVIQLDDVYWGGEASGGKTGRGSPNKVPFVAAVATNDEGHPIAMRMSKVKGFRKTEIAKLGISANVTGHFGDRDRCAHRRGAGVVFLNQSVTISQGCVVSFASILL